MSEPRIEILHQRDPDSECFVRLFINGTEVAEGIEWVDVDPGRGHMVEDWLDSKRYAMDGASKAFADAVAEAYDEGMRSQYVEGEPPTCPRHGGVWGDDLTCEDCTDEHGVPKPLPEGAE